MLKKASIVTALLAASLVAVSPLAFAGEGNNGRGDSDRSDSSQRSSDFDVDQDQTNLADDSSESSGLINLSDNYVGVTAGNCVGNVSTGGAGAGTGAGGVATTAGAGQTIIGGLLGAVGLQPTDATGGDALGLGEGGYAGNECEASAYGGESLLQGNQR